MPDMEKVIGHLNDCMEASRRDNTWVFVRKDIVKDALALLKEQDDLGTELTNAVELIHKKNERIEKLLKEQKTVIRCQDCRHHGKDTCSVAAGIAYPPPDDWFCADGERKEE